MGTGINPAIYKKLCNAQKDEVTEALIYKNISKFVKDSHNKGIILQIKGEEEKHASTWKKYTKKDIKPNRLRIWMYTTIVRCFGVTFGIKLMEKGERQSSGIYELLSHEVPEAKIIEEQEIEHEDKLIGMIKDKSLDYLGSIVLGLNDALVELTGVLAGLTLGLQNSRMIASVGTITGIAAALSMAGSEYLSTKTENTGQVNPATASIYTGIAYIITVVALIFPFLVFGNVFVSLTVSILIAILIIAIFNFYAAVAKDYPFGKRFLEMVTISLSVAFISFFVGLLVKMAFKIDV